MSLSLKAKSRRNKLDLVSKREKHLYKARTKWKFGWIECGVLALFLAFILIAESVLANSLITRSVVNNDEFNEGGLSLSPMEMGLDDSSASNSMRGQDGRDGKIEIDEVDEKGEINALILETDIYVSVVGPIMRAVVKQRFENPSDFWMEGHYVFPLPENAAVDQMQIKVGNRIIEGQIQEKQKAQKTYQKAKKEGKRAGLLQLKHGNTFKTSVANIGPGEGVIIEFEYQLLLDFEEGAYSLRMPIVNTPKYDPGPNRENRALSNRRGFVKASLHPEASHSQTNPIRLYADIKAGFDIEKPFSRSHDILVERQSSDHVQLGLDASHGDSNRDFQLTWKVVPSDIARLSVLSESKDEAHYGLVMLMPPQWDEHSLQTLSREIVFVLDVSGSMQGESIRQAKAALREALKSLKPEEYFNVLWFNDSAWSLFPSSRRASARNLEIALHRIRVTDANGGTRMRPAIEKAMDSINQRSSDSDQNLLPQIIFITDGAVSNEHELFALMKDKLRDTRFFTVGIGSAPNSYFMRKAAEIGRGSFTYVSSPSEAKAKMTTLLEKLAAPAMSDIRLDFDIGQGETDLYPNPLTDLYLGEPLYASFKSTALPSELTLTAQLHDRVDVNTFPIETIKKQRGISVEWARRKISYLQDMHRGSEENEKEAVKTEIIETAIKHHQVSNFTSLVAVDVTPVNFSGELGSQTVPMNKPKGWVDPNKASFMRLAKTATPATSNLMLGVVLLSLAGLMMLIQLRYREV